MIDYGKELVAILNTILPTHYELVLHSGLDTPCISWQEINNYAAEEGSTIGYSRIQYRIKVWDTNIATIQKYVLEIDKALRTLGFKRVSANELYDNNSSMIQKILTYECLALEEFE
jgi:hypothetical protein